MTDGEQERTVEPMPSTERRAGLFPALLKHWRHSRGLSQLDLAVAADVSARHISFLETGRSTPSPEMVLLLGHTLGVPLRHMNEMLRAADHDPVYEDEDELPPEVQEAIDLLKAHHDPHPLIVVDRLYTIRDMNTGASLLLQAILGDGMDDANLARATFDPAGAHPYIVNFDHVGRELLWRIQREVLADPNDNELQTLLADLLELPTVETNWREVDLATPSEPVLVIHLRKDDLDLRFLTMVTSFQAPQNVLAEDLRIETWFPADDATRAFYESLAELAN